MKSISSRNANKSGLFLTCILVFIFAFSAPALAQSPDWQWLKRIGGTGVGGGNDRPDEQVSDVRTDAQGNVYICGRIRIGADFNGAAMTTYSNIAYTIYLAKLDCAGNLLWVRTAGGNGNNYANSLAVDDVGNVYVTGYLSAYPSQPVTFGSIVITEPTQDIFLAKYDTYGNVLWVKLAAPGTNVIGSQGNKIRIDGLGKVHVLAGVNNNGEIYPGFPVQRGWLIARFDTSGTTQQVIQINSDMYAFRVGDFTVSGSDYYFTGDFGFDSAMVCNQTLYRMSPNSGSDIYVVKMDTTGNCEWLRHFGNNQIFNYSEGTGLDFLDNKLILSGIVVHGTMLDSFNLTNQLSINPQRLGFIAALDTANGLVAWANNLHVKYSPADPGLGVTVLPDKSIAIAGYYNSRVAGGTDTLTIADGSLDMYLARMNSSGNWIGLSTIPGTGSYERPKSITSDHLGNIYVGGGFDGNLNFNGSSITSAGGHSDAFIARFGYTGTCTVGIDETFTTNSQPAKLFVYPNPAKDRINIQGISSAGIVELYDMAGRKVLSLKVTAENESLEFMLPALESGLYLLRYANEKSSLSTKILIE